ncbi:MAG: xanthine dehydrogenase small subunit [Spirochaetes bacterium]|nr:xanthine dehydrogenase small subunit [Spirochaetota bacterium]
MPATREKIVFYLNHDRVEITCEDAFLTLSTWLRVKKAMTGTKVVCSEGDCGACTVILGWMNPVGKLEYRIVDSCIQFLFQLDSCHVITVEALTENGKLHPAQQAMVECFGSQCGFCTPGFVMALADLAEKEQSHTTTSIKDKLAGNLCRCTGYEAIVKAGLALNAAQQVKISERFDRKAMEAEFAKTAGQSLKIETASGQIFFKPADLGEALKLRAAMPQLRLVAGATDLGVQHNKGRSVVTHAMFIAHLGEIGDVQKRGDLLEIGATVNWSEVLAATEADLPELHAILKVFAAEQIRNAATIGGNIINASPIADSLPCLFALDARLVLRSVSGSREVAINGFYSGYKKFDLRADEILAKIILPLPKTNSLFKLYKVSKRRDLDISTVTLAIHLQMAGAKIAGAQLAAGGVAATILRLANTEKLLIGAELSAELFHKAGDMAMSEIQPQSDVRGSADFRKILIRNLFHKFYFETSQAVGAKAG